jgi:hypothetical protein
VFRSARRSIEGTPEEIKEFDETLKAVKKVETPGGHTRPD